MSPKGTKYRRALRKNPTKAELAFRELLKQYNIPHSFQKLVYTPTRFYILDFVVRMKPFTIFEIDGTSHQGKEGYDIHRTAQVISQRNYRKFSVVRITNEQVFNNEAVEILKQTYPRRFGFPVPIIVKDKPVFGPHPGMRKETYFPF